MTATVDEDIAGAFTEALAKDAGIPAPAAETVMPAPPRKPDPSETPAPARPARKPRPAKDDRPRVAEAAPPPPSDAKGDYTEGLTNLGGQVWFAASALRGGRIPVLNIPLPDARPYAFAFRQQLPTLVAAANEAAKQNSTVRRHVVKWTGDGSMSWVLGAGIAVMGVLGSLVEIGKAPAEVRAQLAEANDAAVAAELQKIVKAMGFEAEAQAA